MNLFILKKMTNKMNRNKTVLITGATSGIGYEFSNLYGQLKYNLITTGKDFDKLLLLKANLEKKYLINVEIVKVDLSNIEEVLGFSKYIDSINTEIDILINNAGIGVYGEFAKTDFLKELSMIQVNIVALTYITKIVLKKMLYRGNGKILNVASTASFKPGPLMSVYSATKAYVLSLSEAIAYEIRNSGVNLTVLCPGPTNTNFLKKSSDFELQFINPKKMSNPKTIALTGMKALEKSKGISIPGFRNQLNAFVVKFIPKKLLLHILYRSKSKIVKNV
jgi:uncharacterized protein